MTSSSRRTAITSERSAAIGPYSHGLDTGALVFLSGQTPVDPGTGQLVDGDVASQTRRCLTTSARSWRRRGWGRGTWSSATST